MKILLDTCILIDMIDKNQPRSKDSNNVLGVLKSKNFDVHILATSLFELTAVIKNLHSQGKTAFKNPEFSLKIDRLVPIDETFINQHLNVELPYLKGADFMLLCYAFSEKIIFLTEDDKLYNRSKEIDIEVYRTKEFIEKYGG